VRSCPYIYFRFNGQFSMSCPQKSCCIQYGLLKTPFDVRVIVKPESREVAVPSHLEVFELFCRQRSMNAFLINQPTQST
jgi:hypothetical protein